MKAVVVIARGLQLGAMGCYGNPWIDTPALDGFAAEGVVFDQHFADAADPAGARRAWRSGRYRLPAAASEHETYSTPDLLDSLRSQGIHTCLIVDDSQPIPDDFAAGWGEVERVAGEGETTPLEATLEAAGAALLRLEQRDNWLLWIDLATSLPPWNVPEEFQAPYFTEEPVEGEDEEEEEQRSEPLTPLTEMEAGPVDPDDDYLYLSIQTSYAAAVTYLDAGIGQLLEALAGAEGGEEVLVLVTTDVGQSLGEHGIVGPVRAWLHDEIIHLPLIVRLPGRAEAGRRVEALTQAVDLAVTLADWFHAPLPDAHGRSLLPLIRGEIETIRLYACAGLKVGGSLEYALRTPDWAFLLPQQTDAGNDSRTPRLYVKPDDRWEVNDVLQHHQEWAEQLEKTLRDFVTAACQPGPLHVPPLPELRPASDPTA